MPVAKYEFHHVDHDPYLAVSFADAKESWRLLTPRQNHIRIPKAKIVRVEPIDDLRGYRTWIDTTGRFSTVAKFVTRKRELVELERLSGRVIHIPLARLSDYVRRLEEAADSAGALRVELEPRLG